jgi:hypothetical protein
VTFNFGQFWKIAEVAHILGYFLNTALLFQKWVGLHFGRFFFTNSFGHPAIGVEFSLSLKVVR